MTTEWMGEAETRARVMALRADTLGAPQYLNVRCAWCGADLVWVGEAYPVSHGICPACRTRLEGRSR
jgi:hypothetical protein